MKTIFFVDDDEDIQEIMKLIFRKLDYNLSVFSKGKFLLSNGYDRPDLIILDKQLPEMDGLEICKRLKSEEKTKDIPIIMLSASPDIKRFAKKAGAEEGIEKPFSLKKLREIVAKHVG